MKNKLKILSVLIFCVGLYSCELDNYKSPDARFYGAVLDAETNKPIEQDMFEGSKIDIIELGYENPSTRQIRFHSDGTFQENNLFSGKYEVQALRGNFSPTEIVEIQIDGRTEYNFISKPYIRIKNTKFTFDELRGVVTAKFTLEQVSPNPVGTIYLMADKNPNVSNFLRASAVEKAINAVVSPDKVFELKMSTENLVSGSNYYFRIGALISGVSQAKPNFSSPAMMTIDNSKVVPDLPIPGKVLDDCESLNEWKSWHFAISLDSDSKQGKSSVKVTGTGVEFFQKNWAPFDTEVTRDNGYLAFDMYIEDVNVLDPAKNGEFELTSSGHPDDNELRWIYGQHWKLESGWNRVELSMKDADMSGVCDLKAVNFIRFYHLGVKAPIILKIDNIRFYKK